MFGIGTPELVLTAFVAIVLILPFWKIISKAGYPGWLSIGAIIPGVAFLLLLFPAFAEWPALKKVKTANME